MLYVCKPEYCSKNERFTDTKEAPEITQISGGFSFGKLFGNLCSEMHRFTDASYLTPEKS